MKVLAVYPGRFQPFHKGHAQVYQWLQKKFGNAVIATSDKVEAPKSPFNFKEKVKMMTLAGVPSDHIKQVTNPYIAREILKDYDPDKTVLVFAVSQKDMEEDPRFSFAPTKSGKPGYLQPYKGNEKKLKPFGDPQAPKGYVIVTPTFTFDVLGKPATSASELRKQFIKLNFEKQKDFIKDLFGKYNASVHKLMDKKIGEMLGKPKTVKQLKEELNRKQFAPMLDSFVSFASDKLGLKSMPSVRYKTDDDDYNSFAAYNPSTNELSVHTMHRHPMDIFRSVAHELVHHKQNEDGRIGKDIEKEGATGSDIENEANSEAGKIMRWFAKTNPDMFGQSFVTETVNTAAMGGVRGMGYVTGETSPDGVSQYVLNNIEYTKTIQNSTTNLYANKSKDAWMDQKGKEEYKVRATKGFKALREQLNEGINDPGKLKAVFLAGGPGSGKDFVMNKALAGNGLREINSDTAFEFLMKRHGLDLEMPEEERVEREIVRGRAKGMTSRKEINSLTGRLGLIVNGTADDLEKIKTVKAELEDLGYDTMMVFVNTSNEVSRQRNVERGKSGNRKVPDGTDKEGNPDNSPNIRQEKWDLAQKNIGELEKIFGKDSFTVIDNTADIRKVAPDVKEKIEADFNRVRRMTMQFVQSPVKNKRGQDWTKRRARYQGTTQYTPPKAYTKPEAPKRIEMPKTIVKPSSALMDQARRLGLSYYGFGRFGRKVGGKNKVMYHSKGDQLVRVQMNEDLRNWFSKTHPEGNWKRVDTKGNIKGDCAREPGEGKPKCMPASRAYSMSKDERAKSARRKRREDPVANRPGKGNLPINVKTESVQKAIDKINADRMSEEILTEKNKPTNPALWSKAKSLARSKFDVYPSAYANGWAAKWYKSKGGGWKTVSESKSEMAMGISDEMKEHGMSKKQAAKTARDHLKSDSKYYSKLKKAGLEEACWTGYEQKGMKKKGNRMVPNCVPANEETSIDEKFDDYLTNTHNRDMGTTSLRKLYASMTPGQESATQDQIKPVTFVPEEKKKMKLVRKKLAKEDNNTPRFGLPLGGIGPEITQYRPFTVTGFTGNIAGTPSLSESILSWANNPATQQKFVEKYGELAEERLNEAATRLEQCGCGMEMSKSKKSVAKIKETWPAAPYKSTYGDMGTVPSTGKEELNERGADSKGLYRPTEKGAGLTRKGAKHFGIKTAVTTPPSKLDPKGKAAKRRKSFCARMGGMKGPMKDEKGRPTRKAMSLRRWNCEE